MIEWKYVNKELPLKESPFNSEEVLVQINVDGGENYFAIARYNKLHNIFCVERVLLDKNIPVAFNLVIFKKGVYWLGDLKDNFDYTKHQLTHWAYINEPK